MLLVSSTSTDVGVYLHAWNPTSSLSVKTEARGLLRAILKVYVKIALMKLGIIEA